MITIVQLVDILEQYSPKDIISNGGFGKSYPNLDNPLQVCFEITKGLSVNKNIFNINGCIFNPNIGTNPDKFYMYCGNTIVNIGNGNVNEKGTLLTIDILNQWLGNIQKDPSRIIPKRDEPVTISQDITDHFKSGNTLGIITPYPHEVVLVRTQYDIIFAKYRHNDGHPIWLQGYEFTCQIEADKNDVWWRAKDNTLLWGNE